jgi:hypothetical protein
MVRHHRSPPNSAAAGSEVESVRQPGGAKRAAGRCEAGGQMLKKWMWLMVAL